MASFDVVARLGMDHSQFERGSRDVVGHLNNITSAFSSVAMLGAGALGGAILGVGAAAWKMGSEVDSASSLMAASLGKSLNESDALKVSMMEVWGEGLDASIEETGAAITVVAQQMKSLAEDDIASATTSALKLQGVFEDADLERSTNAANVLMNMGVEADKAFDIIASGYQDGLNTSGDWLDSIGEYGNLFKESGFSAEQMFSIMQTGLQGGVLGTDKISDAIKEFGLIMNEGGDEVSGAFTAIGLSYEEVAAQVSSGDATWGDYFDQIVGGLDSLEDPLQKNRLQVTLFGTMAEDLGSSFTKGLSASATSLEDFEGSMEALNVRYNDFSGIAERFKRRFIISILPLRDHFLELANSVMPHVEAAFDWLETTLPDALATAGDALSMLSTGDFEGLANLWADVGPKVEEFAIQLYGWVESQKEQLRARFIGWGEAATGWLIENSPQLIAYAEEMALMLGGWIISKSLQMQADFLTWGAAATNWALTVGPELLIQAEAFGTEFIVGISTQAESIAISFMSWRAAATNWALTVGPELLVQAEAFGTEFIVGISTQAESIAISFMSWGQALIEWIGPAVINFLAEWPFMLFDFLSWIEESAGPILLQLGNWALSFIEWIAPMIPNLLLASMAISGVLLVFISETVLVLGIKLVQWAIAFVEWIATEAVPRLWIALQAMENALFEWVEWGVGWLLEQGANLGSALLDGILAILKNAGGIIADVINDAIEAAIANVKATFGIQSPSRVFAAEIGSPIAEGVASGISEGAIIADALTQTVKQAQIGFSFNAQNFMPSSTSTSTSTANYTNFSAPISVSAAKGRELIAARSVNNELRQIMQSARAKGLR